MVEVIRIPKLGLSDYGELVSWEVDVGDRVSAGQVVAILESEKASAEIESEADGVLLKTYVDEGSEVEIEVGKPLGVTGAEDETPPSLDDVAEGDAMDNDESATSTAAPRSDSGEDATQPTDVKATPRAKRRARNESIDLTAVEGTGPQGAITTDDIEDSLADRDEAGPSDVKATPRAKRRAREESIDLSTVEGTGPQDAITEDDVERALDATDDTAPDSDATADDGELTVTETRELSGTRKTIADRLSRSAREKPHVMGTREVSIEQLERVRDRLRSEYEIDASLNDLLLYLVGKVLADLPEFNAHFRDGRHELVDEINVGYAVDGPRGLVVPVVDDLDERSPQAVAEQRRTVVERVLQNEHSIEDLRGGTFTVTNVGVFDMDVSYSIINPPEVAILAIGRRKYAPVERNGDVDFEKVITFSLTIDHRVLDGADSGAFLERLAEYVEHPGVILDNI